MFSGSWLQSKQWMRCVLASKNKKNARQTVSLNANAFFRSHSRYEQWRLNIVYTFLPLSLTLPTEQWRPNFVYTFMILMTNRSIIVYIIFAKSKLYIFVTLLPFISRHCPYIDVYKQKTCYL